VTISGKGFGTSPSVNAGASITATVNSASDTQIQASFTILASAPAGNQSVTVTASGQTSAPVSFFVQVPTSLSLIATISQGPASCSQGTAGWDRWVTWQVLDQTGQPIQQVLTVSDTLTIGSPNSCGTSGRTGSANTYNTGQFPDHYFLCTTGCAGGNSCQSNGTQTWTVQGKVLSSDVKSVVYKCSSITINGQ
jgi:hypothetical protein